MTAQQTDPAQEFPKCVEHGVWTPIPEPQPSGRLLLRFKDVDPRESAAVKHRGIMTFHMVGCTGHFGRPVPQAKVAATMARQIAAPHVFGGTKKARPPSFFFHLGDIVYKDDDKSDAQRADQQLLYHQHFFAPYAGYDRSIFAIAGNHDGKDSKHSEKSSIRHFLMNFCGRTRKQSPDDPASGRPTMIQPYPYWLLQTPLAYFVGLYTNDVNGGQLDDLAGNNRPQYDWLVKTLKAVRKKRDGRAVFLAVHYPPYSAATNFMQRGDPNLGQNPRSREVRSLGMILQEAFHSSGQYPDAVFSAHAHHYQRITYTQASGHETPYLIVGSGGHAPIENLFQTCENGPGPAASTPCQIVLPPGLTLPKGDCAELAAYNDRDFGFLRLTLDMNKHKLTGEFFAAYTESGASEGLPRLDDSFRLDIKRHKINGRP
jgi:hypothetical protein